jgi:ElaB/YqjD/DUF883 family membrane-anchored ribosome-binding protein
MANEEVIRQQMEETRTSLTEKLETLENQVVQTVQGATEAVSDTVATIKDTVEETVTSVKDSVEDTVSTVKDTVSGSVETVKEYVDIRGYVAEYPWLMMGASIAAGYALGAVLGGRQEQPSPFARPIETARVTDGPPRTPQRNGGHHRRREEKFQAASWLGEFAPEISKLKGMALGALLGTAREMITKSMPGHVGQHLSQIVDNITTKLGGEPMSHSDWESMQKAGGYTSEGDSHESRDEAKMGGSVGSTRRQGPQTMGRFDR